ncbi:MAG: glycoside hydrolase family 2 protein [Fidelibacterota bacterium]|nr:MAG: glycoside hydrolase family 2 protein [Candidatus Neomarinimicrobiota bacterium]
MTRLSLSIMFLSGCLCWLGCQARSDEAQVSYAFAQHRDGSSCSASIDLNGPWQFKATDETEWAEATVPSTVWTDLLRIDRLEDPFYRDNELKVQWVEKKEWEYRRTFQVGEAFLEHDKVVLDCRGLDTIGEIYVNGSLVAKTVNMFIEYEFDIKPFLRAGENEVHIIFRSIIEWDKEQVAAEPKVTWTNSKGRTFFTRKEGSDFGWDWGVRLVTSGIWRSIRLAAYDVGRITDLIIQQDLGDPKQANLSIKTDIEQYVPGELSLSLQVKRQREVISQTMIPVTGDQVGTELGIDNPELWWPNGWGDQPLYQVQAILMHGGEEVHRVEKTIGLRTVELVREPDERGETFGLKVNGHLIFCKGVNWVPADALPDRLTEAHYLHLLSACRDAHMNMIRLWGGGLYEPDIFYEYCDENGILIWHDFMFAVGPFIANESYLANVRAEIANVVTRLRHHPSIALWSGNNECESNMSGGQGWIENYPAVTWEEYDRVFGETIPETAARTDPDRPYWPSSPHHPLDRDKVHPDWETSSGDAHPWDVWHGAQPFSWYEENLDFRFVSEFGFQSLPDMETIRAFTAPEDRYFASYVLDHHNKCGKIGAPRPGNQRIAAYIAEMFNLPTSLENWVYVSQIMHGEGMKVGAEAYRRNFPHTTGALYWQLNDNWPTISGSSIDYFGRWKALQYFARRFFNPVLVTGRVEDAKVSIWGVNDRLEPVVGELQWILARFDGTIVLQDKQPVVLPMNSSTLITSLDFTDMVGEHPEYGTYRKDSYENRSQFYLSYKLVQSGVELTSNVSFFTPPKYLRLVEPRLKYRVHRDGDSYMIRVSTDHFAAYVALGLKEGYAQFSDNFFHLLPGESREIRVVEHTCSPGEFKRQLYVQSLVDSYRYAIVK